MSERQERVFGGVPAWLLVEYLVELGGEETDSTSVRGPGWSATVAALPGPAAAFSIGRVAVTIAGPEAERVMQELRQKALRGGG